MKPKYIYKKIIFIVILLKIIFFITLPASCSYSLIGTSGLVNIPTKSGLNDGEVNVGFSYFDKHFAYIGKGEAHNFYIDFSIGYLPRLEMNFRATLAPGVHGNDLTDTYKDGAVSVQYCIFKESIHCPAISVGLHDFYSYSFFNALYIVTCKTLSSLNILHIRLHMGYGVDWINKHWGDTGPDRDAPVPHHLVGLFGGIELGLTKQLNLLMEYDTEKFNCGVRAVLFNRVQILLAFINFNTISGGMSYKFRL